MSATALDLHQVLASIPVHNFSIGRLLDRVGEARGRRILAMPLSMPDVKQYGAWLAGPTLDVIFYDADTARVHQVHIILHELSHIALGHKTLRIDSDHISSLVLALRTILMRDAGDLGKSPEERDAEALAGQMQRKIIRKIGLYALTQQMATAPLWSEIGYGLGLDQ